MNQDKATPRPWKFGGTNSRAIYSPQNGREIAVLTDSQPWDDVVKANAALIVSAVNEHAALVAVAEAAQKLGRLLHDLTTKDFAAGYDKREREALNAALSALANVRSLKG